LVSDSDVALIAALERPGTHRVAVTGVGAGRCRHLGYRLPRRALAVAALAAGISVGPVDAGTAWGSTTVNATFHVPASVQTNPCFAGDWLNLSGDIHVVITTTASNGGYHVDDHLNSLLSGVSITTGTKYVNSEDQDHSWFAGAPFPVIESETHDFDLISQSAAANYVLHVTMHATVDAQGVPAAVVDNYRMDCTG
jgi:hypothetical protein